VGSRSYDGTSDGETRNARVNYRILIEEYLGEQPPGKLRRGWNDNIKMNTSKIGF
jgi:hypothetical protein